ncbi:MAG: hypothetical protein AAFR87_18720, partial [Bacteroidota bacterium]
MSSKKWNNWTPWVFATLAIGLGGFWGFQLHESLTLQYAGEWDQLGGFVRWLMGYVVILSGKAFMELKSPKTTQTNGQGGKYPGSPIIPLF